MMRKMSVRWMLATATLLLALAIVLPTLHRRARADTIINGTQVLPGMTAREAQESLGGTTTPNWTNDARFKQDVFSFARVIYTVDGRHGFSRGTEPESRWRIDWPNSDLNFSYRLQQMTSMKADPDGVFVRLTDKKLKDYPFIYFVEAGRMTLQDNEIPALRDYLLNGGFAMFDDFWGNQEWKSCYEEIKKVFPDREAVELPLTHPIFHGVFDLKEKPQVPGLTWGIKSETTGKTYEDNPRKPGSETVHYRAIFDDKGRIMVLLCHNTDLGDGWEREGENEYYFREFSEKKAYPIGINIIFYAMTH